MAHRLDLTQLFKPTQIALPYIDCVDVINFIVRTVCHSKPEEGHTQEVGFYSVAIHVIHKNKTSDIAFPYTIPRIGVFTVQPQDNPDSLIQSGLSASNSSVKVPLAVVSTTDRKKTACVHLIM